MSDTNSSTAGQVERLPAQVVLGPLPESGVSRAAFLMQLANAARHHRIVGCDLSLSGDIDGSSVREIDRLARRLDSLIVLVDVSTEVAALLRSLNSTNVIIGRTQENDGIPPSRLAAESVCPSAGMPLVCSARIAVEETDRTCGALQAVLPAAVPHAAAGRSAVRTRSRESLISRAAG